MSVGAQLQCGAGHSAPVACRRFSGCHPQRSREIAPKRRRASESMMLCGDGRHAARYLLDTTCHNRLSFPWDAYPPRRMTPLPFACHSPHRMNTLLDSSLLTVVWPSRDAASWLFIAGAVLAGGMLRGMTGFGAALLMAPLLSLVLSARETLCIVTLINALPLTHALSPSVRRLVDHRMLLPMIGAACVGIPAGLWLVSALPQHLFGRVVGIAVIASALALLFGVRLVRRRTTPLSLGAGLLSGILTGFGGVGGPPAILYVLGVERDSHRARASFLVYFGCLYPLALLVIVLTGLLDVSLLLQGLLLAPLFHFAGLAGERLYRGLDPRHFRRLVLGLLMTAGAVAAWPVHALAVPPSPDACSASTPACAGALLLVQEHLCSAGKSMDGTVTGHRRVFVSFYKTMV